MSSPASRRQAVTSFDVTKPSQPRKRSKHLAGIAAEPAAAFGQQVQQPDLVRGRPFRQETAEAAMFFRDLLQEAGVIAHRHDLGAVAHDPRIARELLPEIVRLECQRGRLKAEESLLETRPFGLDHAPGKAGAEHPPCHLRKHAVVTKLDQGFRVRDRRQQFLERRRPSLAFLGARPDGFERSHAARPFPLPAEAGPPRLDPSAAAAAMTM